MLRIRYTKIKIKAKAKPLNLLRYHHRIMTTGQISRLYSRILFQFRCVFPGRGMEGGESLGILRRVSLDVGFLSEWK